MLEFGEEKSTVTRRAAIRAAAVAAGLALCPLRTRAADATSPPLIDALLRAFSDETIVPNGGVDVAKSRWQKPGRGAAVGSTMFAGGIDPRYFRYEAEAMYRIGEPKLRDVADALVSYMVRETKETHPAWAMGNALEMIGLSHEHRGRLANPADAAKRLVNAARARSVEVTTLDGGVKFRHFPCGYGVLGAKDAGWTNDLSMFGAGLVHAFDVTGDPSILDDAISFAEYFVQPWRKDALGKDGYWRCGTWHEQIGSWVIGPSHYTGFESTDAYGDEASWVFSTLTCTDFLMRLYRHKPDPRYLDRCKRAAQWTFRACQFDDGGVGMCGRDDKWLGFTADAVSQVAWLHPHLAKDDSDLQGLVRGARRAFAYLETKLVTSRIEDHGVEWVNRKTSTDPLVNVAMLWACTLLGWLNGQTLFK